MTILYLSPSGGLLPNGSAPRQFTATEPLAYACVRFFDPKRPTLRRPEEVVYRDGAFRYPYSLASTKVGNLYTVERQGGWSDALELYAEEQTVPPAGGQTWGAVYNLDLTAQPSQNMATAGAYTIDGLTWWSKGPLLNGGACELVNGSGLRMTQPGVISNGVYWTVDVGYSYGRIFAMALSQIPNFNPIAPYAVMWRFAATHGFYGDNVSSWAGLMDATASAAVVSPGERAKSLSLVVVGTNGDYWVRAPYGDGDRFSIGTTSSRGTALSDFVEGVIRFQKNRYYPLTGPWAGAFGAPDDYQLFGPASSPAPLVFSGTGMSDAPSFVFGINKGESNAAKPLDIRLTHLRVTQPKVAA